MSGPVTVAVVSDGALRAYHRNGQALAQVAQLVVGQDVEPAAIATMMADLGDTLGWGSVGRQTTRPMGGGRAAGALPPAHPRGLPKAKAKGPRVAGGGRRAAGEVDAERAAVLAVIEAQPSIMRSAVAAALGISVAYVKRRTDELIAQGLIDARPMPGVPERGPGAGHGLYPIARAAPADA